MTNTSSSNWKLLAHSLELLLINSTITWTPITNTFNSIMSPFDSKTIPNISIHSYLERINKHAKCSDPCFVVAYIYINRVLKNKGFILSRQNIYRLILASMVVAIKYNDDVFASNKSYSMIGGVDLDEINILEPCILDLLQFHLFVTQDLYILYTMLSILVRAEYECLMRLIVKSVKSSILNRLKNFVLIISYVRRRR